MKRRFFLRNSLLSFAGAFVAPLTRAARLWQHPKGSSISTGAGTVKGHVRTANKALAGVVISDGYTVVQTDPSGKYEFPIHPAAVAVFISVPSGYHFPHEHSICRHYVPVHKLKDADTDFILEPLEKDDAEHSFILWADPQVKDQKDVERMMATAVPDVRQYLSAQPAGAVIHGICVGDLVWDNHSLFVSYEEAVKKMGIPFFQCIGNHDMDYNMGGDDRSDDTFQDLYGPSWYSFNRGKAHYVVIDNVRYLGTGREYDGYITDEQLQWLAKDLALVPRDHLFFICLHIPVHSQVKNNDALYTLLQGLNAHILSGHTHFNKNVIKEGVFEHNHGTVCGAWWTGPVCGDGTPAGYGIYKVRGTDVSWQYKSIGKPLDHQMTLFLTDGQSSQNTNGKSSVRSGKTLLANIWNEDPEWSVTCFADGVSLGEMDRTEGFDPLAYSLYLGPDLPKPRGFVEPNLTDHLFTKTIPAGTKLVRVEAVDRFGQLYSAEQHV